MNNYSNYNYQQDDGYDYSANRCRICNRELQDPRQLYGEWCARKNGLNPYGGPVAADKKERIEFIAANNYDNNELKIPTIDSLTIEEYNKCIEETPAFAEYMLYHTNNYNKKAVNEFVIRTVYGHGGMKQGNPNVYQVIYTAPITDDPKINNTRDMNTQHSDPMHSDVNMYDNYQFTIFDAMTWLIQTGGRGNFVLQTRATEDWGEDGSKRVGIEMEFDMGLLTGRKQAEHKDENRNMTYKLRDAKSKKDTFGLYLDKFVELKDLGIPIGVYSGGPNEQGYRDIWNNINTHNSGNHIPYWEGIDETAYETGVHYNHFPNAYQGGNLIYDINNFIYNDVWKDSLEKSMWLSRPIQ